MAQPLAGLGVSPAFLVAITLVLIGQVLLARTVWGRYIVAVGANEQAARFSGIATRRIKLTTFVLSGLMAALGAVFQVGRLSSADPNGGAGMELAAIAAVVIGGTSLMGGQGSVFKSFLGVLLVTVLQTGLAQVGATEPLKRVDHRRRYRAGRDRRCSSRELDQSNRRHLESALAGDVAATLMREVSPLSRSSISFGNPADHRSAELARLLELAWFSHVQKRVDRLAQERIEAGSIEIFGGVADDRDLLKGTDFGDFQAW